MIMRADELAQEGARQTDERFYEKLGSVGRLVTGALGGGAALTAGSTMAKLAPFFSDLLPVDMAVKGISKVSPKIGEYLRRGQSFGLDLKEGIDFLKEQFLNEANNKQQAQNIITQYSPELFQFVDQEIKKGKPIPQAGAEALRRKDFVGIIKKMAQDNKTSWSEIVDSVFGQEGTRQQAARRFNEKVRRPGLIEEETQRFQQGQSQPQGDQVNQQLLDVLQRIQQFRGGAQ